MANLQVFCFDGNTVRIIDRDGNPWWVAADVCRVLDIANHRDAVSRLDEDERDDVGITDAIGREQQTTIINESGLYSLILTSRKPEAKRFKKWVTSEVLPALRKTGSYTVQSIDEDPLEMQARLLLENIRQQNELKRVQQEQQKQLNSLTDTTTSLKVQVGLTSTHMTLMGWCSEHKLKLTRAEMAAEGKYIAKLCRKRGLEIKKVSDLRYGSVNVYPIEVLVEWQELYDQALT